jgi:hypothetical protein
MIVFDLRCVDGGDRFEAWFGSSADFEDQLARGLVECPSCGSKEIVKAPMAPRLSAGDRVHGAVEAFVRLQSELLRGSEWVGPEFAERAMAMHVGDEEARGIHGQATATEARKLVDEGVPIAPLLLPVVPPRQVN